MTDNPSLRNPIHAWHEDEDERPERDEVLNAAPTDEAPPFPDSFDGITPA